VDPLRIAVRVVFMWVVMQLLVRLSGKQTVNQGTPFDFALAAILGDLMDDLMWAEIAASQFLVATGVLMLVHSILSVLRVAAPEKT
jgi:uncharacterized membrane protein YcaP (DUF421 family)